MGGGRAWGRGQRPAGACWCGWGGLPGSGGGRALPLRGPAAVEANGPRASAAPSASVAATAARSDRPRG